MSGSRIRSTPAILAAMLLLTAPVSGQVTVEAQLGTDVVESMPQGAGTAFPADVGTIYCWTRVTGAADQGIRHVWTHDGMEFPVDLEVGGSPWRTWSSKEIPPEWSGEWSVRIVDVQGNVLETLTFTVGA
jgi:hypothetical protein